jgi:pimeloyl-ACP methyl ester carboxylesterase
MNWLKSFFRTNEQKIKPTVVWIHGANQTSLSFAYLRSKCNFTSEILINYSSMNSFHDNLETMKQDLTDAGPVFLIGHSMGGLYALHLTQHTNAVGGVSISTPLRGSSTADWAKYVVPSYPLFKDVGRRSKPVLESMEIQLNIPWTQLISTTGSVPYHGRINDGVVTIDSMRARDDVEKIELAHSHYEIVCSDVTAEIISARYSSCCETLL